MRRTTFLVATCMCVVLASLSPASAAVGAPSMVEDLFLGAEGSEPAFFAVRAGTMYFSADDGINGRELWHSDGTPAGTEMLADINPGEGPWGPNDSDPAGLTNVSGMVFFVARVATGPDLWVTDGTEAGTELVKDIPGTTGQGPRNLTAVGTRLFFTVQTLGTEENPSRYELWTSNGTPTGTRVVKVFPMISGSSGPDELTNVGGVLYLLANDGATGDELWKSNGTPAGTVRVKNLAAGAESSSPEDLTAFGSKLFFSAHTGSGRELWKSDGTAAGTLRVKDIYPGPFSGDPSAITKMGSHLFFRAESGVRSETDYGPGFELWKSDGTGAGTTMVKNINPGSDDSYPAGLTAVGPRLFFTAYTATHGRELWRSDGTATGTKIVKDSTAGAGSTSFDAWPLAAVGSNLVYSASKGTAGYEPWSSDGTAAGTAMMRNINPDGDSDPREFIKLGNRVLFNANDGEHGRELWRAPLS